MRNVNIKLLPITFSESVMLPNYVSGTWTESAEPGDSLVDPLLGTELVRVSSAGVDAAVMAEFMSPAPTSVAARLDMAT